MAKKGVRKAMLRQKYFYFLCSGILLFVLIGATYTEVSGKDYRKQVPHISAQQALALFKLGRLIPLDVHVYKNQNRLSKIVGALYVPATKIGKVKLKTPKELLIGVF
jgi:hypothetical protein